MRAIHRAVAALLLLLPSLLPRVPALGAGSEDGTRNPALERLRADERAREDARAAAAAEEVERRRREQQSVAEERARAAARAEAVERAFAPRREAMREWHRSFAVLLVPVLAARGQVYQRMRYRMFAAVRPYCSSFRSAIEAAAPGYVPAPERRIDALARDLLAVLRQSARYCVDGGYFSFTVREGDARRIVGELDSALAPYGLELPRQAGEGADEPERPP